MVLHLLLQHPLIMLVGREVQVSVVDLFLLLLSQAQPSHSFQLFSPLVVSVWLTDHPLFDARLGPRRLRF